MSGCPECGAELRSEVVYERAYGYGGYRDYEEFARVEVRCLGCRHSREYSVYDLEELALADAGA